MRQAVRRAVLWRSGGQALVQLVTWASTLIVIRLLAPADYGLMALVQMVVGLLVQLGGQGLATALVARDPLERADVARAFGALLLLGLALAGLQVAAAPAIAAFYREPRLVELLRVMAIAYPLQALSAIPFALNQRALDFRRTALVEGMGAITQSLAMLAMALAGLGVWALALGQIVGAVARALGHLLARRWLVWPDLRVWRSLGLMRFGWTVTLNGLLFYALAQAPVLAGGRLMSTAQLGLYSTAFFLAALPAARFLPLLSEVGLAAYARAREEPGAVAWGFRLVTRAVALAVFPLFAGLAATAPDAAPVLLGRQWAPAAPLFVALGLAMPFYTLFCLMGPPAYGLGRPVAQTRILVAALALMGLWLLGLTLRRGPPDGLDLALGWLAVMLPALAVAAAITLRLVGVSARQFLADAGPPLLAAMLMGLAVGALRPWLPGPPALRLALCVAAGAGLYLGLARLLAPVALRDLAGLVRR